MNRMMVDIETLDTSPTAVVFQVGALVFDNSGDMFHKNIWHLDILPQIMRGRTMNVDTQKFWMAQKEDAWFRHHEQTTNPYSCISELNNIILLNKVEEVWSNSPSFDAVILKSLAGTFGAELAWDFRQDRDLRTLRKIATSMGWGGYNSGEQTSHNSLQDCFDQANAAVSALEHLAEVKSMAEEFMRTRAVDK